jgi:D-alanyl-D-alanine carboxypeptidase/D-alanyl-D-alanine-endopeptidase (penicillin-binding protein 4)
MFKKLFAIFIILGLLSFTSDKKLYQNSAFQHSVTAYFIKNITNNQIIDKHNEELFLTPASTQKIITTSLALDILGKDYEFYSFLALNGNIQNQILQGDLIIAPNFNPGFCNKRWGYELNHLQNIIEEYCEKKDIKSINGKILIVDSLQNNEINNRKWIWEDMGNYYGASTQCVILNENKLELYFTSEEVGEITKITSIQPNYNVEINNFVKAYKGNNDKAYAFSKNNDSFIEVRGEIPANQTNFKVIASLPNPLQVLKKYIKDNVNIKHKGIDVINSTHNINTKSEFKFHKVSALKVIQETNSKSNNILAETLWAHILKLEKNTENLYKKAGGIFNQVPPKLFDGCGLSPMNNLSCLHLNHILEKQKNNPDFKESLSVLGKSGTLSSWLKNTPAEGNIWAKSGSMEGVRAYTGYIKTKKLHLLTFTFIVNNYVSSNESSIKSQIQTYLQELFLNN